MKRIKSDVLTTQKPTTVSGPTDDGSICRERSHEAKPTWIAFAQNSWTLRHPLRMRSTSALINVSAAELSDAEAIASVCLLVYLIC